MRAAHALWAGAAFALAVLAPTLSWRVGGAAICAGLVGLALARGRWAPLGAAAVALGAAPVFVATAGQGGVGVLIALLAGLACLALRATALPYVVPALALVVGLVEAARLLALTPRSAALAAPLLLASLGAAAAGAHPGGRSSAALVLALGLSVAWPAWRLSRSPPHTVSDASELARRGLVDRHIDALVADPELGLSALRQDPSLHPLALALAPHTGLAPLLEAGWFPDLAPLPPALRLELAARLDEAGEGGRALRVLRRGRADARVAWSWGLMSRRLGREEAAIEALEPPPETPSLPGVMQLDWVFLRDGLARVEVHLTRPVRQLVWTVEATSFQGPPELVIEIDGQPRATLTPPDGRSEQAIHADLRPGPHSLAVRFHNDLAGAEGDRNATVLRVSAAPTTRESAP